MTKRLTPLEKAIVGIVAEHNWPGFHVNQLEVTRRENTGVGRYTYLIDHSGQSVTDGSYGAGTHFIEMEGVPNGLFFIIEVKNSHVSYIEIVSSGTDSWDGEERAWRVA